MHGAPRLITIILLGMVTELPSDYEYPQYGTPPMNYDYPPWNGYGTLR